MKVVCAMVNLFNTCEKIKFDNKFDVRKILGHFFASKVLSHKVKLSTTYFSNCQNVIYSVISLELQMLGIVSEI